MPCTLRSPCEHLELIQKSRFLTYAAPVSTSAEAQAFIQTVSDPSATHNCWAWKIGNQYRFSDDGEPGGTAGRPMLTAIEGQGFDQVVVVITRFFGGIKLGTGGLARAYGGCAAKCLQSGEAIELITLTRGQCHCRFADLARLKARLPEYAAQLEQEVFDAEGAWLTLATPEPHFLNLSQVLSDLSRGHTQLTPLKPQTTQQSD